MLRWPRPLRFERPGRTGVRARRILFQYLLFRCGPVYALRHVLHVTLKRERSRSQSLYALAMGCLQARQVLFLIISRQLIVIDSNRGGPELRKAQRRGFSVEEDGYGKRGQQDRIGRNRPG